MTPDLTLYLTPDLTRGRIPGIPVFACRDLRRHS
jgi:hypothetical protein